MAPASLTPRKEAKRDPGLHTLRAASTPVRNVVCSAGARAAVVCSPPPRTRTPSSASKEGAAAEKGGSCRANHITPPTTGQQLPARYIPLPPFIGRRGRLNNTLTLRTARFLSPPPPSRDHRCAIATTPHRRKAAVLFLPVSPPPPSPLFLFLDVSCSGEGKSVGGTPSSRRRGPSAASRRRNTAVVCYSLRRQSVSPYLDLAYAHMRVARPAHHVTLPSGMVVVPHSDTPRPGCVARGLDTGSRSA